MNKPDLKKIILEEWAACAKSPEHFMKKYCFISHPQRGKIKFNLYPFQEKVLTLIRENKNSIILKSNSVQKLSLFRSAGQTSKKEYQKGFHVHVGT